MGRAGRVPAAMQGMQGEERGITGVRAAQRRAPRTKRLVLTGIPGRVLVGLLAGNAAVWTGDAARAGTMPTLLCQREEVLRVVERTVRGWSVYNRMVGGTALETPTAAANAVICHATMTGVAYEPTPGGWVPRSYQETRRYDVQVVGNRIFVQVPR